MIRGSKRLYIDNVVFGNIDILNLNIKKKHKKLQKTLKIIIIIEMILSKYGHIYCIHDKV